MRSQSPESALRRQLLKDDRRRRVDSAQYPYVPKTFRDLSVPVVPVMRYRPNPSQPGRVLVYVPCPYCPGRHVHDVNPAAVPDFGHRMPPCWSTTAGAAPGYFIEGTLS